MAAKKKNKIDFASKLMNAGGAVAGGIAGSLVANKVVPMVLKNAPPIVQNLAPLALGIGISLFIDNPVVSGFANGMIATSGKDIAGSFLPAIAGIGNAGNGMNLLDVPDDQLVSLEGTYDTFDDSVQGAGEFSDFVNGPYDY